MIQSLEHAFSEAQYQIEHLVPNAEKELGKLRTNKVRWYRASTITENGSALFGISSAISLLFCVVFAITGQKKSVQTFSYYTLGSFLISSVSFSFNQFSERNLINREKQITELSKKYMIAQRALQHFEEDQFKKFTRTWLNEHEIENQGRLLSSLDFHHLYDITCAIRKLTGKDHLKKKLHELKKKQKILLEKVYDTCHATRAAPAKLS